MFQAPDGGLPESAKPAPVGNGLPAGWEPFRNLVFEDETCWVFNKPSGLPSVPGKGPWLMHNLTSLVQAQAPEALVVHRLDMSTSGLILLARGAHWQRVYSRCFAQQAMDKRYAAVVAGCVKGHEGEIDAPLMADWPQRPRQMVSAQGKPSVTRWRRLGSDTANDCTRLELQPLTGRSHQLRVHLLHIGHPIWGDALYAPEPIVAKSPRLLLHAQSLRFTHPGTGQELALHRAPDF
jgi:tRNA pseudouridine32 synthase/23S rRNA pseudouridine746 synthase